MDQKKISDIFIKEINIAIRNGTLFDTSRLDGKVKYFQKMSSGMCRLMNGDLEILDSISILDLYCEFRQHIKGVSGVLERVRDKINEKPEPILVSIGEYEYGTDNDLHINFDLIDQLETEMDQI